MTNRDRFFLAVMAMGTLAVLSYLATPFIDTPEPKKVVELVLSGLSAFGTLLAAVVALWLGLASQEQNARTERMRAAVTAAKIAHEVNELRQLTNYYVSRCLFSNSVSVQAAALIDFAQKAAHYLAAFDDDDFLALMPLPNHIGGRFASSVTTLRAVAKAYTYGDHSLDLSPDTGRAIDSLTRGRDQLEVVTRALNELASGAAPAPSATELARFMNG